MKKVVILLTIAIVIIVIIALKFVFLPEISQKPEEIKVDKPPIVDHFACSDYCPGPQEKYMVKVYQGVEDEEECRKLGGRPLSYTGWGTTKICLAE